MASCKNGACISYCREQKGLFPPIQQGGMTTVAMNPPASTNSSQESYDLGLEDGGLTPLMQACRYGRDGLVKKILTQKVLQADPSLLHSRDDEGYSPLHLAVIAGNRVVASYLINKGADVHAVDKEKHSVVHWATVCGELEILDILSEAKANFSTPDIHGAFPIHYAAQMCGPNSELGNDIRVGLDVLQKLIGIGVDISVTDHDGRQPLLWAASAEMRPSHIYCPSGSADAILALVNARADVSAEDKDGLTALHCAASRGHLDCLDVLIGLCGAEGDTMDSNGCTPLFYAVTLGHADCTELLLNHGAHPDRQDRKGRTPAHCGAAKGQLETLKLLYRRGADLWKRNVKGDFPLHEACQSGRKDLILWLLSMMPDAVNAPNHDGRCPLHIAAITNNVELCKIIMDHKASVNPIMRNSRGQLLTPVDAAVAKGNRGCAKYLQLHGGLPASKITDKKALQEAMQRALESAPVSHTGATPSDITGDERLSSSASSAIKSRPSTVAASPVDSEAQTDHVSSAQRDAQTFTSDINIRALVLEEEGNEHSQAEEEDQTSVSQTSLSKAVSELVDEKIAEQLLLANQEDQNTDHEPTIGLSNSVSEETEVESESKSEDKDKMLEEEETEKPGEQESVERESESDSSSSSESENEEAEPMKVEVSEMKSKSEDSKTEEIKETATVVNNDVISPVEEKEVVSTMAQMKMVKHTDDKKDQNAKTVYKKEDSNKKNLNILSKKDKTNLTKSHSENVDSIKKTQNSLSKKEKGDLTKSQSDATGIGQTKLAERKVKSLKLKNDIKPPPRRPTASPAVGDNSKERGQGDGASESAGGTDGSDGENIDEAVNSSVDKSLSKEEIRNELSSQEESLSESEDENESSPKLPSRPKTARRISQNASHPRDKQDSEDERIASELVDFAAQENKAERKVDEKKKTQAKRSPRISASRNIKKKVSPKKTKLQLFKTRNKKAALDEPRTHELLLRSEAPDTLMVRDEPINVSSPVSAQTRSTGDSGFKESGYGDSAERFYSDMDGKLVSDEENENSKQTKRKNKMRKRKKEGNIDEKENEEYTTSEFSVSEDEDNLNEDTEGQERRESRSRSEGEKFSDNEEEESGNRTYRKAGMRRGRIKSGSLSGGPPKVADIESNLEGRRKGGVRLDRPVEMSITQAMQTTMRKYAFERRLFQQLLELKRLQIRSSRANEHVAVKRMVDAFNKEGAGLGLRGYGGPYKFQSYEKYLYDQLRFLQSSQASNIPKFKPSDDVETLRRALRRAELRDISRVEETDPKTCNHTTHRCHHAMHAYTGIPCAAYVGHSKKRPGLCLPRIIGAEANRRFTWSQKPTVGLCNYKPDKPLTVQLQHGETRQEIVLPTEMLDKKKKYHLTFTIKPNESGSTDQEAGISSPEAGHTIGIDDPLRALQQSVTPVPREDAVAGDV